LYPELLRQNAYLFWSCCSIIGIVIEHPNCYRSAVNIGKQPDYYLRLAWFFITIVTILGQFIAGSLQIGGGYIIEKKLRSRLT